MYVSPLPTPDLAPAKPDLASPWAESTTTADMSPTTAARTPPNLHPIDDPVYFREEKRRSGAREEAGVGRWRAPASLLPSGFSKRRWGRSLVNQQEPLAPTPKVFSF